MRILKLKSIFDTPHKSGETGRDDAVVKSARALGRSKTYKESGLKEKDLEEDRMKSRTDRNSHIVSDQGDLIETADLHSEELVDLN